MLEIDHLFAGFKLCLRNLFRLGMIYFLVNLFIIALISISIGFIIDESTLALLAEQTNRQDIEKLLIQNPALLTGILKALLLGLFLSIPLMMASWFAPSLVLFDNLRPLKAMLLSLKACNTNILGFIVYLVIIIGLMLLALVAAVSLPCGLYFASLAQDLMTFCLILAVMCGFLGGAFAFGPLVADISQWFDRRRSCKF